MDIDQETEHKATALHLAAFRGHWSTVECLVGWGALLNTADMNGDTPLSIVVREKNPSAVSTPQLQKVNYLCTVILALWADRK